MDNQDKINCEIHGENVPAFIMYTGFQDKKEIGKYCFMCMNDFLEKNVKNYAKES